ncbi:MAG: DUF2442 domain-containing protein [Bacteroidales bacterium]|nr:DUF2442 domain-containing protein [Bacteroidales bacterium]MCF8457221.1 DUF2442 domain-containing protein [Bacteroidales bacterium]
MKIRIDYKDYDTDLQNLKIATAKYLSDYAIRVHFNDGSEKLVDFKPFLSKSLHPSIKKYLDENKFSEFEIKDGNLNWNDYDLIFPIWDLYSGKVEA